MYVLTLDQVGSTASRDRVPELLAVLTRAVSHPALAFERSVGHQVQGLVAHERDLGAAIRSTLRLGDWSAGVGIGAVSEPLPESTREASGSAYVAARRAAERARSNRMPAAIAVEGGNAAAAADLEAAWHLVAVLSGQRTAKMWEAIDTVRDMGGTAAAAAHLGVSPQAVTERLRRAGWRAETNAGPLLDGLARRADGR